MKTIPVENDALQPAVITTAIEAARNKDVTAIYPQPTSASGRGQIYGRSPIDLPPLPIESIVMPIPWAKITTISGLAALILTGVDWGYGLLAGDPSVSGSLEAAMIGVLVVMVIFAGLSFAFYKALHTTLVQAQLAYVQGIIWGSILFILPVTQGLRALLTPELFAKTMPVASHVIVYVLCVVVVWVGTVIGITGLLLRSNWPIRARQRVVISVVVLPYLVTIPVAIMAFIATLT